MKKLEPAVFFPAALLVFAGVGFAVMSHDRAETVFSGISTWLADNMGWLYLLGVALFLFACIIIGLSEWGRIKLGPQDSEPEYGFIAWFAMLFSAGMGIGLMFFGVAEPLTHYANPPYGEPFTGGVDAAETAMVTSFFHWGVHAWAIYAMVGLSLAYFAFRHGLPLTIRSALFPLFGDRVNGPLGHAVDVIAVIGTLFGVATSLGFGVTQINAGLNSLFDIEISTTVQVVLIAVITSAATVSVVTGLDKGIKFISQWNLVLAIGLLVFVFVAGPTIYLLDAFVQNVGGYLDHLADVTFQNDAYGDGEWMAGWTLFYWGWWISWSPFVGMFIARISRGRTIREFIFGVLVGPSLFTFFWMSVYGNAALQQVLADAASPLLDVAQNDPPLALFAFLETLPLSGITSVVAIVLVTTFFVTSSDSGSLVIDTITSGGHLEPPVWQRVFWAVLEGVVAAVLLVVGGLAALQSASLAAALPFTVVIILSLVGLLRALHLESARSQGARIAPQLPVTGASVPWRERLRLMFATPTGADVAAWLEATALPALEEVGSAIGEHGATIEVGHRRGRVDLVVHHGDDPDFLYAIERRRYDGPHFSFPEDETADADAEKDYARAEVVLSDGGQQYDIYGYTKNAVIRDVVRQYERHLQWLHLARKD
jgi:choline/glycine/proline betaine transport protein